MFPEMIRPSAKRKIRTSLVAPCVIFTIVLVMIGSPSAFAVEEPLPVLFEENSTTNTLEIKNIGECPIINAKIKTLPPERDDLAGNIALLSAKFLGVGSFVHYINKIEVNDTLRIYQSKLTNPEGKILDDNYKVGSWLIKGDYCGKQRSAEFPANQ